MSIESKTKEAVLGKLWVALNNRESDPEMHLYLSPDEIDMVHEAMEIYARNRSIEMLKWYAIKMVGFIEYIKDIRPIVTSNEIEEKIKEFEGQTFEKLYELFSHQTE